MAADDKAERQLCLMLLLSYRRLPLSRADIFAQMSEYYSGADVAKERMFERDKDELRNNGVVIEAIEDPFIEGSFGYRVDLNSTHEHRVQFSRHEALAVSIAAKSWHGTSAQSIATGAALRVQALARDSVLSPLLDRIDVAPLPAAFAVLSQCLGSRHMVTFEYQRPDGSAPESRRVEPWALLAHAGHWYLVGRDTDRADQRVFRVDRICSAVVAVTDAQSYAVPEDFDALGAVLRRTEAAGAVIFVRQGTCGPLRRMADHITQADDGWDLLVIGGYELGSLARTVAGLAPHARVQAPEQLVSAVRSILQAVIVGATSNV